MPSLRQLEYLQALSHTRHFRRAAERVGISQPTLSAQLKALEDRLGVQLVERDQSGVVFTAAGEEILAIAQLVLGQVQDIRDVATAHRDGLGGIVRLGVPPTIGPYLVPRMVPGLHAAFPQLKLYIREGIPSELPIALARGTHDLLLTPVPVLGGDLETRQLFREPIFLVVAADHPFAASAEIDRTQLKGQAVLSLGRGYQLHAQVEALCEEFGAQLLSNFEGTSLDTLRQMVGMGMGISFLPGLYVRTMLQQDEGVRILELRNRALYRTIGCAWRRASARSHHYERIIEHLLVAVRRDFPDFALL